MSFEQTRSGDTQENNQNQTQQIVVDDPQDFAKTRQLRSIFDARDQYTAARRDANRACEEREIDFGTRNARIWRHMQDFAMAVEPLFKQHDSGQQIYEKKEYSLDTWAKSSDVVDLKEAIKYCREKEPELYQKAKNSDVRQRFGNGISSKFEAKLRWAATPKGVNFRGIQSMMKQTPRLAYLTTSDDIKTSPPPQRLSDEVFRDVQSFVDDIGLGFNVSEEQQTKIDADLIKELNEWRQSQT